jgi:hypothetical protein
MSVLTLKSWSERQQVVAILLMAGAMIVALWFFLLLPQNRDRKQLESDISNLRKQLASRNYLVGEHALQDRKSAEVTYNRNLHSEWTNMVARMQTFARKGDLTNYVGHIDYKVALFDVRQRLLKKSRTKNIRIRHYDLGMEDAVRSDEDARKLMLQLRTVEKIVDFALDLQINMLRDIDPLPPLQHKAAPGQKPFAEEYPVDLEFYGNLENLYQMFAAILDSDSTLVLRRLRVLSEPNRPDVLRVTAVMSTLVFLRDPDELVEVPKSATRRLTPLGH